VPFNRSELDADKVSRLLRNRQLLFNLCLHSSDSISLEQLCEMNSSEGSGTHPIPGFLVADEVVNS
jgi:hypothetical protein